MSPLKVIIPLFIVLGILQAAVLSLPFIYWRFAGYMGPINKFLFGSFLCVNHSSIKPSAPSSLFDCGTHQVRRWFIKWKLTQARLFLAFIAHPLLIIALITFTIAPTLLSLRHNLTSRLSTAYTALVPASITESVTDLLSSIPFTGGSTADTTLARKNRDWLFTAFSSYVGWKMLGNLPSLMVLLVVISLWKGREADGDWGRLAKSLREGNKDVGEKGKGVAIRSTTAGVRRNRDQLRNPLIGMEDASVGCKAVNLA